mgnify:CR=1
MAKGKSSAGGKRVKKALKSNSTSITNGSIKRLARRGGVKRIAGPVYAEVRDIIRSFVDGTVRDATAFAEHAGKKTVSLANILGALKRRGTTIYGF